MSKPNGQELSCEFSQRNGSFKLNDDISGKIIVQPQSHISFHKVIFEIYWSITNGTKTEERLLKKQEYATQRQHWMSGKTYELDFSFKSQAPISFSSKKLKIERYLKVRVIKHESGWSLGKNHPDYQFSYKFPYILNPSPDSYRIQQKNLNLNYNNFIHYLALPMGAGILGGLNGFPLMDLFSAGILGGGLYYTFVGFGKIGKVQIAVSPFDDTHFQVKMNIQRNWSSIKKIELAHFVCMIPSRAKNHRSNLNHVPLKKLLYQDYNNINSADINIVRSYHSINLPPTLTTKYFDVYWELQITIHLKNNKKNTIQLEIPMDIVSS